MSYIDSVKISNKKISKFNLDEKRIKNKIKNNGNNNISDSDYKTKKIAKSKSYSVLIQKRKNSEKKKYNLIPINFKGPSIKTNITKKKICYNKSDSDFNHKKYLNFNNNTININEYQNKKKKNSQINITNHRINNFNFSSKKKNSFLHQKFHNIKGIITKPINLINNNNNNIIQKNNKNIINNN